MESHSRPMRASDTGSTQEPHNLGDHDPRNWSKGTKWAIIVCISVLNFLDTICSSASATSIPLVLQDFGRESRNKSTVSLVVSIYVLGTALGPLVVAPLSETYGRRWVYLSCNLLFIILNVGCGLSTSIGMLIGFRVLTGCVSAAPATIGGGTIADLMIVQDRTIATGVWMGCSIVGPILGPILGGLVAEAAGWRWVYFTMSIAGCIVGVPCFWCLRETHRPSILRKASRSRETSTTTVGSACQRDTDPGVNLRYSVALILPLRLLLTDWVVFLCSLYSAVADGYMFIVLATFAEVFVTIYDFSTTGSGFASLGMSIGAIIGHVAYVALTDRTVRARQAGGEFRAEDRLKWMPIGALAMPAGLCWYGWTSQAQYHWIVPILGLLPFGMGLTIMMVPPVGYLIDVFIEHAASAIAATVVVRALTGAFMPLIAYPLYHNLGQGWGNSLLALVGLLLSPMSWLMFFYGEKLRTAGRARSGQSQATRATVA